MPKKFILFADLDDTLFQSNRKCPPVAPLIPMAYLKDGIAHSFATPGQASLLNILLRAMTLIPVTARNAEAFSRVAIESPHGAVVNYGGVILNSTGRPERAWLERSGALAEESFETLREVQEAIMSDAAAAGLSTRVRVIEDFGIPFYVCAKSAEGDERVIDQLEPQLRLNCKKMNWAVSVHRNGNNLTVLPRWLDKRPAVEHLRDRYRAEFGDIVTIGMGDSISDIAFMHACDYSFTPNTSQITRAMEGL